MSIAKVDQQAEQAPGLVRPARCGSRRLTRIAAELVENTWLWWPEVRYEREQRYYRRIAATQEYEAWLLTWLPGQGTGLHDHGGASGAFAVAVGTLTETTVADLASGTHVVTRALRPGRIRAFGNEHVHNVVNRSDDEAISLHVYAPALSVMRRYQHEDGRLRELSSEAAGVDW